MFAGSKPVVVVGSINTDLVAQADRLPLKGETITGNSFHTFQGGKGANQAVAAGKLGANAIMVGKVGSDSFGAESIRQLTASGVDCTHVAVEPGDSGLAVITVSADGQNTIVVIPGANASVTPAFIEAKRDVLKTAGMVLAQLEIPVESVLRLAQICHEEKVPLMLDPAPARELPGELLSLCSWITPNETEALFYARDTVGDAHHEDSSAVAAALLKTGVHGVVLKLGERGSYIEQGEGKVFRIPSFKVAAVDTTAAGDTFNGAFAAAFCAGRDIEWSGRFASAAAAISVTRMGAQASMPNADEVMSLLSEQADVRL
jgi:ribokinase